MAERFEIGEVAIYVRPGSPYYGTEVVIASGPYVDPGGADYVAGKFRKPGDLGIGYHVKRGDADRFARPEWLRKKKPPRREIDQIVSFEDVRAATGWSPSGVVA